MRPARQGGIAVVGFLLPLLPKSAAAPGTSDGAFKLLLSSSVIAFALSASVALLQRFFASSGMFHHIKAMKFAFHELLKATALSIDVHSVITRRDESHNSLAEDESVRLRFGNPSLITSHGIHSLR